MFIEYKTFLEQSKNNIWTGTITLEVPLVQSPTQAGFIDELTFLKQENEHLKKVVSQAKIAFAALNEVIRPIY